MISRSFTPYFILGTVLALCTLMRASAPDGATCPSSGCMIPYTMPAPFAVTIDDTLQEKMYWLSETATGMTLCWQPFYNTYQGFETPNTSYCVPVEEAAFDPDPALRASVDDWSAWYNEEYKLLALVKKDGSQLQVHTVSELCAVYPVHLLGIQLARIPNKNYKEGLMGPRKECILFVPKERSAQTSPDEAPSRSSRQGTGHSS